MFRGFPQNKDRSGSMMKSAPALAMALAGFSAAAVYAAPNISGSIQAGYNYNLTTPFNNTSNTFHSYDAQSKSFTLNNAHLVFSGSDSATGLGYAVETDFGSDAKANNALDGSLGGADDFDLQEAYGTWGFGPGRAWGLKAGKYATYQGIEVVEGGANPTISRGFLFGFAEPVTHTGAEVAYAMGQFDVHVGAVNGWDLMQDNNANPTLLAKVGLNLGAPLALSASTLIGQEKAGNTDDMRMSFDITGVTKSIAMIDLWFQFNFGMEDKAGRAISLVDGAVVEDGEDATWIGCGVQPLIRFNDWFGLGLRYEYFSDPDGARTLTGIKDLALHNITLAPTAWLTPATMVRAEFRMDMANEDVFQDRDGEAASSQAVIAADFVTGF